MNDFFKEFFRDIGIPLFVIVSVTMIPLLVTDYYSSCKSAKIYNIQNNTTWTCSDFFWASEQINSTTSTLNIK